MAPAPPPAAVQRQQQLDGGERERDREIAVDAAGKCERRQIDEEEQGEEQGDMGHFGAKEVQPDHEGCTAPPRPTQGAPAQLA